MQRNYKLKTRKVKTNYKKFTHLQAQQQTKFITIFFSILSQKQMDNMCINTKHISGFAKKTKNKKNTLANFLLINVNFHKLALELTMLLVVVVFLAQVDTFAHLFRHHS